MRTRTLALVLVLVCAFSSVPTVPASAQSARPFSLPFNTPPGPSTWFLGQQYGNTSGAYNLGKYWYAAGQGLHFGIDFSAPCGTPVVALADGVVDYADNLSFGSAPHNLIISHGDLGYTVLYGHLLTRPTVVRGQPVKHGEVVAQSGDPDETCTSRPHLHLEVRSMDYRTAYNPAPLIDADWAMLSSMGHFDSNNFVKDLNAPNRWQTIDSQPEVHFGGRILNSFDDSWPVRSRFQPPSATLPLFLATPVTESSPLTMTRLTQPGCCSWAWWSPDGESVQMWDGLEGQRAAVYTVRLDGSTDGQPDQQGFKQMSPDGRFVLYWNNGRVSVTQRFDGATSQIVTGSAWPRFSPGSQRLLWQRLPADSIPGSPPPLTEIWISNVDGSGRTLLMTQSGGSVTWLDEDRLLLSRRPQNSLTTSLIVYTISTGEQKPLIDLKSMRGLSVGPSGRLLLFYLAFQDDPNANGMYVMDTFGNPPSKLPFFGSVRWRDSLSVVYIPYGLNQPMQFRLYDLGAQTDRPLTDPQSQRVSVANDDWSVAPNGQAVMWWSADDYALWTLRLSQPSVMENGRPADADSRG
ncbi:MAG: M23 family metallopeptidase [Anaerolineae bacterium]|nr:M23 family metallopeptidase [Anaerolineae bacterium]